MSKYARESLLNFVYKTLCKVKKQSKVDSELPCHFAILKKKVEEEIEKLKKIRKEAIESMKKTKESVKDFQCILMAPKSHFYDIL